MRKKIPSSLKPSGYVQITSVSLSNLPGEPSHPEKGSPQDGPPSFILPRNTPSLLNAMRFFLTPPPCRNTCGGISYVSLALDLELLYLNDIPTWPWHIYTGLRVVTLGGILFFQEKRSHKKHILPHSLVHAPILWITFPAEIFVAKVSFRLKSWSLKNSLIKIEPTHHKIKHFVMWNLSNFCIFTEIHIHQ